ncbi:hypothetical protein F5X97DRAFT_284729 [Nemania serpens]|nr:hypothetical protein F5X97DRAFT_284729 [Nemania serpens]
MHSANEHRESPTSILNKRPTDDENSSPTETKRRKRDCEAYNEGSSRTRLIVDAYTIGWICALHIELAAARSMLNTIHDNLDKISNDSNTYTLGSLYHHNVVIACLPTHRYGTNNAAVVASNICWTFPFI